MKAGGRMSLDRPGVGWFRLRALTDQGGVFGAAGRLLPSYVLPEKQERGRRSQAPDAVVGSSTTVGAEWVWCSVVRTWVYH